MASLFYIPDMNRCGNLLALIAILVITQVRGQGFFPFNGFASITKTEKGNGISVADYDGNGQLDIYIVAADAYNPEDQSTWNRLLQNQNGSFTDVTIPSGLNQDQYDVDKPAEMGIKMGASWGDFNNDGHPDLFLTNYGYDQLWKNNGDGTFQNITETAGVAGCDCYSSSGLWWDYDNDGDLDLYVSDWNQPNRMYENTGNEQFTDVSEQSNLKVYLQTWTSLPIDVNYDGLQDLYLMNDFADNDLFINQGNGRFIEETREYNLNDIGHGMGVDVCDLYGDGDFDIYLTNIWQEHPNPFFVNQGGSFEEQWSRAGFKNAGWGWGVRFFDMDHDMDEDMYLVNQQHFLDDFQDYNRLFVAEDNKFEEQSEEYGVNNLSDGRGLTVFDYNNDGDLDMAITNWGAASILYSNSINQKGNWIKINLVGTESNRDAFGTVIRIKIGDQYQHRLNHGANFLGQDVKPIHFGTSNHELIDELTIFWPSGRVEKIYDLEVNQKMKLVEGEHPEVLGESYGTRQSVVTAIETPEGSPSSQMWIEIFPNPITEYSVVNVRLSHPGKITFALYDQVGKQVYANGLFAYQNNLDIELPKYIGTGIFYFRLEVHNEIITRRIIKM